MKLSYLPDETNVATSATGLVILCKEESEHKIVNVINGMLRRCFYRNSFIANEPGERRREPGEAAAS